MNHVENLIQGTIEAGMHSARFNTSNLASGIYIEVVNLSAVESEPAFSGTMKMSLSEWKDEHSEMTGR